MEANVAGVHLRVVNSKHRAIYISYVVPPRRVGPKL